MDTGERRLLGHQAVTAKHLVTGADQSMTVEALAAARVECRS
ncbi:hypothetical protein [Streptomyces sannanensis]